MRKWNARISQFVKVGDMAEVKDFSILTTIRLVRLRLKRRRRGRSCEEADRF